MAKKIENESAGVHRRVDVPQEELPEIIASWSRNADGTWLDTLADELKIIINDTKQKSDTRNRAKGILIATIPIVLKPFVVTGQFRGKRNKLARSSVLHQAFFAGCEYQKCMTEIHMGEFTRKFKALYEEWKLGTARKKERLHDQIRRMAAAMRDSDPYVTDKGVIAEIKKVMFTIETKNGGKNRVTASTSTIRRALGKKKI